MSYHNPVLLQESVDALSIKEDGVYVDVTFGGGGHSREILKRLGQNGRLFGFDQDPDALGNVIDDVRFVLIPENFRYISRFLRFNGVRKVDGVLADLGVSSHQFDEAERGFSTRFDGDLDMRMNQKSRVSAKEIVNEYSEEKLAEILFLYGELRNSRNIAKTIVEKRADEKIDTSFQLREVLRKYLPKAKEHKIIAQIFQAIRVFRANSKFIKR
jgi:16S rRNA (cytosine1402-N4)-methyltransferase